ncbi:MAG: septum formation initiator family protein [Acidobacteria bacterium]|nr:septum formation initiator family protein [Acidobacteriota bacterium]
MADKRFSLKHKKELYYISLILVVGGILLLGFAGPGGYLELKKARRELELQRARVENLRRSNAERLITIEALKSDKEAIERYARKKGYGRENEIVQQLPENPED